MVVTGLLRRDRAERRDGSPDLFERACHRGQGWPEMNIRAVRGPTAHSKAPTGSIRKEFGSNIIVNAAHASDAEENAQREFGIVKVGDNTFKKVVEEFYGK